MATHSHVCHAGVNGVVAPSATKPNVAPVLLRATSCYVAHLAEPATMNFNHELQIAIRLAASLLADNLINLRAAFALSLNATI